MHRNDPPEVALSEVVVEQLGFHWMLDLYGCRCHEELLCVADKLNSVCVELCQQSGMTVLKSSFYQFEPKGATGVVLLSESHLATHTWPESGLACIDIYVCNYTEVNEGKGKKLVQLLLKLFNPADWVSRNCVRGSIAPPPAIETREMLTDDFGYLILSKSIAPAITSRFQTIEVFESKTFGRYLKLDGSFQCSERDEFFYHEPLIHMAMSHHANPKVITLVGGGDGGALTQILKWPTVQTIDHIEIDADVIAVCKEHLPFSRAAYSLAENSGKYKRVVDDASHYLVTKFSSTGSATAQCDVLILDLTDQGGPSNELYSKDFFSMCAAAIGSHGVMTLHLASPTVQPDRCADLVALLRTCFACVVPFIVSVPMSGGQWLMALCTNDENLCQPTISNLESRMTGLSGRSLKVASARTLNAMKVLPPYLSDALEQQR